MKKLFTLAAIATLAAGAFTASASVETDRIFSNIISHPDEGENVEYFSLYNIGFPDASEVTDNSVSKIYEAVVVNTTTGKEYELLWSSPNGQVTGEDGNGFQFLFASPGTVITTKGEYTISFPEGAFLCDGEKSPAIVRHFSIGMDSETPEEPTTPKGVCPALVNYELTPESDTSVESLSQIIVTFPDLGEDIVMSPMLNKTCTLTNTIGREFKVSANQYEDYTGIIVDVEESLIDGYYTLTLEQGLGTIFEMGDVEIYGDNVDTPEIVAHYTVGDYVTVIALEGEDALYTVVDAGGRVVLSEAPAEALKGLEAGFYVINGKKTFLRK